MITRYTRPQMAEIWSDEYRYNLWLQIELLICETLGKSGLIPEKNVVKMKKNACFDADRIHLREAEIHHEFHAFVEEVSERLKTDSKFFHTNVAAADIIDTALAVQLTRSGILILHGLNTLLGTIESRISTSKDVVMVARTHGTHAEPISLAFKLAVWFTELDRHRERLLSAVEGIRVGKLSGPVGTFAHLSPDVEDAVCSELGLRPDPISTQIIQRDRHAAFICTLAILATSIEKIATEIRNLQRTEIHEVEETNKNEAASSTTLPHQKNPVLSENICGLARIVRTYSTAAMENMVTWHERDITNSSVERVILPDSCMLLDFMLERLNVIVRDLVIFPDHMMKNLALSKGLIFSKKVVACLIQKGVERSRAFQLVFDEAMKAHQGADDFKEMILANKPIRKHLSEEEVEACFDIDAYLKHLPVVFKRIGL